MKGKAINDNNKMASNSMNQIKKLKSKIAKLRKDVNSMSKEIQSSRAKIQVNEAKYNRLNQQFVNISTGKTIC